MFWIINIKEGWLLKTSSSSTRNGAVIRTLHLSSNSWDAPMTPYPFAPTSRKETSVDAWWSSSATPRCRKLKGISNLIKLRPSLRKSRRAWKREAQCIVSKIGMRNSVAKLTFVMMRSRRFRNIWAFGRKASCWLDATWFF